MYKCILKKVIVFVFFVYFMYIFFSFLNIFEVVSKKIEINFCYNLKNSLNCKKTRQKFEKKFLKNKEITDHCDGSKFANMYKCAFFFVKF